MHIWGADEQGWSLQTTLLGSGYLVPNLKKGDDSLAFDHDDHGQLKQTNTHTHTHTHTHRKTTDFVVVPIEDTEHDSISEPAKSPIRTDLSEQRLGDVQRSLFEETSIPLPGTPIPASDDEGHHVSVTYKPTRGGSGHLTLNVDIDQSSETVPDSPSSSQSFSSRGSTKSTDILLPKEK